MNPDLLPPKIRTISVWWELGVLFPGRFKNEKQCEQSQHAEDLGGSATLFTAWTTILEVFHWNHTWYLNQQWIDTHKSERRNNVNVKKHSYHIELTQIIYHPSNVKWTNSPLYDNMQGGGHLNLPRVPLGIDRTLTTREYASPQQWPSGFKLAVLQILSRFMQIQTWRTWHLMNGVLFLLFSDIPRHTRLNKRSQHGKDICKQHEIIPNVFSGGVQQVTSIQQQMLVPSHQCSIEHKHSKIHSSTWGVNDYITMIKTNPLHSYSDIDAIEFLYSL